MTAIWDLKRPADWQPLLPLILMAISIWLLVWGGGSLVFAWCIIGSTMIFVLTLVYKVAKYATAAKTHKQRLRWIPNKWPAFIEVTFMFVTLVTAFGALYLHYRCAVHENDHPALILQDWKDALYFSIVTITTVGYGDYVPDWPARWVVIAELGCGFLFLIMVVPILASRFADFSDG